MQVESLSVGYRKAQGRGAPRGITEVVHDVSFCLAPGRLTCLIGANGCGKTTTLKAVMGLLEPIWGTVLVDGVDLASMSERDRARAFAYIPQSHRPPFPFSVADVVMMGRTPHLSQLRRPTPHDEEAAWAALRMLGLEGVAGVPYTELSGGQQQLALIARALAQESDLLVMDEPTAALDFGNQQLVLGCLRGLCGIGKTILMVTHDPDHVLAVADDVVAMAEGRIVAQGPAESTMTSQLVWELYRTHAVIQQVRVEGQPSSQRVCIPVRESDGDGSRPLHAHYAG